MNLKPQEVSSAEFSRMDDPMFLNALKETFQHIDQKLNYFVSALR